MNLALPHLSIKHLLPYLCVFLWAIACYVFFQTTYAYHFFYQEQNQLFLLSWTYCADYLHRPAWLASLVGDFLTQFLLLSLCRSGHSHSVFARPGRPHATQSATDRTATRSLCHRHRGDDAFCPFLLAAQLSAGLCHRRRRRMRAGLAGDVAAASSVVYPRRQDAHGRRAAVCFHSHFLAVWQWWLPLPVTPYYI